MCKSTSYNLKMCSQGPTGRKRVEGGVSGPAEDLRPVSKVEAGVDFRPAGNEREQVADSLPRRQPGTGTRWHRVGVDTPSLHLEVPDTRFASLGRVLDIRQSMGWTKVCETAPSGIWVQKGDARTRMFPENLDHFRVGWRARGSYETAWVTPGHDCLCPCKYGRGTAVRPQTKNATHDSVICLLGRVAPLFSPWCARGNVPTGVNLNRYSGSGSSIPWHSDNESLFGPPNQPKLIVSMSLGHSVEFQVRRRQCGVSSPIQLDHGDILVMDGSAQSEYEHRFTMGGGIVTGVIVHPARRCTSPLGVVPVGSGDGVGDCHDVANFQGKCLLFPFISFGGKSMLFLQGYGFLFLYTAEYACS